MKLRNQVDERVLFVAMGFDMSSSRSADGDGPGYHFRPGASVSRVD
jgi:hypothetical protein